MTKIAELNEIDEIADGDLIYVRDVSDPAKPDKKAPSSKVRPAGARITNHFRFAGNVAIAALAAGVEVDATVTVTGAVIRHASFDIQPPASIAVLSTRVSANDTLSIRFRNLHASSAYAGGNVAYVALVSRSV
ncbi:hypothetical protein C0V73_15705 [Rhizobium sp. TH135]|uniref:hypothetical protein n=1 Tax=Rhizobium sp. TH135 TaxID=2067451 RepID=UPI000C7B53B0|nr:hypothetical protein [Rhizobium sp. TH135]PLK69880.1 hypothetical protein C0V73_15705 [Rhizobium sp. TH135]